MDETRSPGRLRRFVARLKRDVVALWLAVRAPDTPWAAKAVAAFALLYLLSPIDPIPDFIPVIGLLDELVVLPVLVWLASLLMPAGTLEAARSQADAWLAQRRRKPRWKAGAAVVLLTWGLAAWWLVSLWRGV